MKKGKYLNCIVCNQIFYSKPSHINRRKFCSYKCAYDFRKGKHHSLTTEFKKGFTPWNKGITNYSTSLKGRERSKEFKEKISKTLMGRYEGSKNFNWKGGITKNNGYIYILKPEHPFCNPKGYIKRARLVMEQKLGRYLKPKEVVHHINRIKDDDRPENLKLFANNSSHSKFHNPKGKQIGK